MNYLYFILKFINKLKIIIKIMIIDLCINSKQNARKVKFKLSNI